MWHQRLDICNDCTDLLPQFLFRKEPFPLTLRPHRVQNEEKARVIRTLRKRPEQQRKTTKNGSSSYQLPFLVQVASAIRSIKAAHADRQGE